MAGLFIATIRHDATNANGVAVEWVMLILIASMISIASYVSIYIYIHKHCVGVKTDGLINFMGFDTNTASIMGFDINTQHWIVILKLSVTLFSENVWL